MAPLTVFVHIPKCAGTTFEEEILSKNLNFIRYPVNKLHNWDKITAVGGHFNYNLVCDSEHFANREKIFFTLLREPIKRLLSYYYFCDHQDSIEYWLTAHKQNLSNVMVRYLSSCTREAKQYHLDKAKEVLNNINFGLTEHFDDSLRLFKSGYPEFFKSISYERKNVTKKKYSYAMQSDEVKQKLVGYNDLDIELYQYAKKLFKERINEIQI